MTRIVRILGLGDNTVDTYRDLGMRFPGGNAVNVAANVARFGHYAAYLGRVGNDDNGRLILAALEAEGVDVSRCQIVSGRTATTVVDLVSGDRKFVGADPGVRAQFRLTEEDYAALAGYDLVHTSIYSYVDDVLGDIAAASRAVSFDFSQRWTMSYLERIVPHTTYAFLSTPDLAWSDVEALTRRCIELGAHIVVATHGAEGAVAVTPTTTQHVKPRAIEAVDTLGAGDAFIARCLTGFTLGEELTTAMTAASSVAAAACGYLGGFGHGEPLNELRPG